ncbi:MAG: hypothetical protein IKR28_06510 [Selenomonadaceae bacterium]|nr:hypothetical protein [Selenomonadaceae bacterium]
MFCKDRLAKENVTELLNLKSVSKQFRKLADFSPIFERVFSACAEDSLFLLRRKDDPMKNSIRGPPGSRPMIPYNRIFQEAINEHIIA